MTMSRAGNGLQSPPSATTHSLRSSYREMLLEHLFIGDLLRELWCGGVLDVEVLKPQVDDAGYDVVVVRGSVTRHIQLKASHIGASTSRTNVHLHLGTKEGGCVVWIWFDPATLHTDHCLWYGGAPCEPLPDLGGLPVARHTKADSTGHKSERPNIRVLSKGRLEKVNTMMELEELLFGPVGRV